MKIYSVLSNRNLVLIASALLLIIMQARAGGQRELMSGNAVNQVELVPEDSENQVDENLGFRTYIGTMAGDALWSQMPKLDIYLYKTNEVGKTIRCSTDGFYLRTVYENGERRSSERVEADGGQPELKSVSRPPFGRIRYGVIEGRDDQTSKQVLEPMLAGNTYAIWDISNNLYSIIRAPSNLSSGKVWRINWVINKGQPLTYDLLPLEDRLKIDRAADAAALEKAKSKRMRMVCLIPDTFKDVAPKWSVSYAAPGHKYLLSVDFEYQGNELRFEIPEIGGRLQIGQYTPVKDVSGKPMEGRQLTALWCVDSVKTNRITLADQADLVFDPSGFCDTDFVFSGALDRLQAQAEVTLYMLGREWAGVVSVKKRLDESQLSNARNSINIRFKPGKYHAVFASGVHTNKFSVECDVEITPNPERNIFKIEIPGQNGDVLKAPIKTGRR